MLQFKIAQCYKIASGNLLLYLMTTVPLSEFQPERAALSLPKFSGAGVA